VECFGNGTAPSVAALALVWARGGLALAAAPGPAPRPVASFHWADPTLAITPDPEDEPLLITVNYQVSDEWASDFWEAMDEMRIFRRRESAVSGVVSWAEPSTQPSHTRGR